MGKEYFEEKVMTPYGGQINPYFLGAIRKIIIAKNLGPETINENRVVIEQLQIVSGGLNHSETAWDSSFKNRFIEGLIDLTKIRWDKEVRGIATEILLALKVCPLKPIDQNTEQKIDWLSPEQLKQVQESACV